jgi:hypothetical protein
MRLIARVQRTANELHEQHQKMTVHVAVLTKTKHLSPHALCATAARGTQIHARCVGTVSALQYSYIFPPAPPLARHQVCRHAPRAGARSEMGERGRAYAYERSETHRQGEEKGLAERNGAGRGIETKRAGQRGRERGHVGVKATGRKVGSRVEGEGGGGRAGGKRKAPMHRHPPVSMRQRWLRAHPMASRVDATNASHNRCASESVL